MRDTKTRTWRWKVEPGMEDAFDDLLGWLLSSQRDTEAETAGGKTARLPVGDSGAERLRRRALWSRCCARTAYRAA
jgi:hypothetical protein